MLPPKLFMRARGDRPFLALWLLLAGVFVLAAQDVMVKKIADYTSFWQFQSVRSLGNMGLMLMIASAVGGYSLIRPKRVFAVAMRALMLTCCMICFFGGVQYITVSQMSAGLYTYPLFVTILAGPLLGEKVGIWRFSALAIGMSGALLLINPFSTSFHPMQILPVVAGFFYALNILILRRYCRRERPLAIAFMVGLMFFVVGIIGAIIITILPLSEPTRLSLPFLLIGWPEFSMIVLGFCMLASIMNLSGNILLSRAYQIADSSWLAPLDFSYLIFAMIWGRILFGYWPDGQALLGMVLIAVAGVLIVVRENIKMRAKRSIPD